MTPQDRAWAWTASLLAIHQAEEVLAPVDDWYRLAGTTGSTYHDAGRPQRSNEAPQPQPRCR